MAKTNYRHQKHLREENKKKKLEEKKLRKAKTPADPVETVQSSSVQSR